MEEAWNQALRLSLQGKSLEVDAVARERAEGWREDFERKQRLINEDRKQPDISHERLEQLAMYCERVPLGHYEGNGGLFEFVPILVNVVSVSGPRHSVCAHADARSPRSYAKRSRVPLQKAVGSCHSTCTASRRNARIRSSPQDASLPYSLLSARLGRES